MVSVTASLVVEHEQLWDVVVCVCSVDEQDETDVQDSEQLQDDDTDVQEAEQLQLETEVQDSEQEHEDTLVVVLVCWVDEQLERLLQLRDVVVRVPCVDDVEEQLHEQLSLVVVCVTWVEEQLERLLQLRDVVLGSAWVLVDSCAVEEQEL